MEVWVMSVSMTGMEQTGHNVGKTLTEKLLMTILDIQKGRSLEEFREPPQARGSEVLMWGLRFFEDIKKS
jgi:hypothetical protein